MKILTDTLQERGKWSIGRLTMFVSFGYVLMASGYATYKTGVSVDIPVNWLGLISLMYGINRIGQAADARNPK